MRIVLSGTGSRLAGKTLTNDDLSKMVDTSDEWISTRTGIRERHVITEEESMVSLAGAAAREALADAGITGEELGLIVVGTSTADKRLPSTACELQPILGAKDCICMDVSSACSGFVYSLSVAYSMMHSLGIRYAMVVGGDVVSREMDWKDRTTCVLFGDAAGAAVLKAEEGEGTSGILSFDLGADGYKGQALYDNSYGEERLIHMDGQAVFKFALRRVPVSIQKVMERAGVTKEQVDLFVLHQANLRILDAVSKKLEIPSEKIPHNLERTGNTSAGSVPLLLDELIKGGRIKKGDLLVLSGFGAGLTWGSVVVRV